MVRRDRFAAMSVWHFMWSAVWRNVGVIGRVARAVIVGGPALLTLIKAEFDWPQERLNIPWWAWAAITLIALISVIAWSMGARGLQLERAALPKLEARSLGRTIKAIPDGFEKVRIELQNKSSSEQVRDIQVLLRTVQREDGTQLFADTRELIPDRPGSVLNPSQTVTYAIATREPGGILRIASNLGAGDALPDNQRYRAEIQISGHNSPATSNWYWIDVGVQS